MLVSVIITIYNLEKYLEECIISVCNQTYKNIEIILINDGSTDGSADICRKYISLDNRIHLIEKENEGLVTARKIGAENATGKYILYVDGDDWIESEFVEKLVEKSKNSADMVVSLGHYKDYPDHSSEIRKSLKEEYISKEFFLEKVFPNFISENEFYSSDIPATICCYLLKKDFILNIQKTIDNRITIGEDMTCIFRCLLNADSISILNYSGYHYRQHCDSMMHSFSDEKVQNLEILYHETIKEIHKSIYDNEEMVRKLNYWMYFAFMTSDIGHLLKLNPGYLFPYTKVKPGSKILVYGAGTFGQQLINTLKTNHSYSVLGWLDKGWKAYSKTGLTVLPPLKAIDFEYDYIIIAVTRNIIATQIANELLQMGIPDKKIVKIDMTVLTSENLPFNH